MKQSLIVGVFVAATFLEASALLSSPPHSFKTDILEVWKPNRRHFDKETLLEIANHGLALKAEARSKHVIIVGAGIAGLTAGYTLKQAGYNVTIIEASDRAGGRIRTHYADNWFAELGPMRIPEKHEFVNAWVKKLGLSYQTFISENPNTWYYVNGVKVRKSEGDAHPELLGYETEPWEKGKTAAQLFNDAINALIKDPGRCTEYPDCLREYDSWSLKGFLHEVGKLSDGALRMIGTLFDKGLMHMSLAEIIAIQHQTNNNQTCNEITEGMESLPMKIAHHLEDDIIYGARVNKVTQENQTVTVYFDGATRGTIKGSHVIVTTTMQSASFITFEPQLGLQKRNAIRDIHYISLLKIVLVFKSPFWLEDGINGGRSKTDLPIRFIYYPSNLPAKGPYPLVVSYTLSDDADKFCGLCDEEILIIALDNLATIHGPSIYDLYINGSGLVKKWRNDPYSLGGVAVQMPYQIREYGNAFDTPEGGIYFCGGDTAVPRGWMDTSVRTAMRTVAQIHGENVITESEYMHANMCSPGFL